MQTVRWMEAILENNTYIALTIPKPASIIERAETLYSKETTPANEAVLAAGLYTGMNEAGRGAYHCGLYRKFIQHIHLTEVMQMQDSQPEREAAIRTRKCFNRCAQMLAYSVNILRDIRVAGCMRGTAFSLAGPWYWIDTCWMDSGTGNVYYLSKDLWSDHILK